MTICVSGCLDIISLCELEKPAVPTPARPGQSVRLAAEVNAARPFRRGPGYLWEQQFGGGD